MSEGPGFPANWGLGMYTTRELAAALAHVDEQLADDETPGTDRILLAERRTAILHEQEQREGISIGIRARAIGSRLHLK